MYAVTTSSAKLATRLPRILHDLTDCTVKNLIASLDSWYSLNVCSQIFFKYTHSCWWADFSAFAAYDIFLRTSVLVLAFSKASLWNSMVDKVPSICCSCFSSLFFLFKAIKAAENNIKVTFKIQRVKEHYHTVNILITTEIHFDYYNASTLIAGVRN